MEEKPQTTTPIADKHSINWGALILWPFVILILYALSAGPVMKMMQNRRISFDNEFVWKFYAPLDWAYMNTPLRKPLGMYLHLWDSWHFDKNGEYHSTGTTNIL